MLVFTKCSFLLLVYKSMYSTFSVLYNRSEATDATVNQIGHNKKSTGAISKTNDV